MTFTKKVTLPDFNRSAGRACRVKIRIVPAYTWLCQFVQALLAIVLLKIGQKAQIIRHLLQKTGSNASRDFIEWKWMRCVIWKTLIRMMCRNHQYHRLTGDCFLPVRLLYRLPLFLPMLNLLRHKPKPRPSTSEIGFAVFNFYWH